MNGHFFYRNHQTAITALIIFGIFFLFLFSSAAECDARRTFQILSIDLQVEPNPIPCGGTATATATIQTSMEGGDHPEGLHTIFSLWDYDTWFRDGDDELDKKPVIIWDAEGQTTVEFTLHCQIKDEGCELYGPADNSGESRTYVFVTCKNSEVKSPKVYVKCTQQAVDAILYLDGGETLSRDGETETTLNTEVPLQNIVQGTWRMEYDPADLQASRVEIRNADLEGYLNHEILNDHILFTLQYPPGVSKTLDGELLAVFFATAADPSKVWDTTYVQCGDEREFIDVSGASLDVCMGGPHSLFIPPEDSIPPQIHPDAIRFNLREIIGGPGSLTDNLGDSPNYLSIELYDETHALAAESFAESGGAFALDTFFMLNPEKTSTIMVYDGLENVAAHSFVPSPDLADAVSMLQMLAGIAPAWPLMDDMNGNSLKELSEALYILGRISGLRETPPLALSITGSVTGADAVTLYLSGSQDSETVSNAAGNYAFTDLPANETYTVTPAKAYYLFTPAELTFDNMANSRFGQDFIAVYQNQPPSSAITDIQPPSPGAVGAEVQLTAVATDVEGEQVMIQADWGDGVITGYSGLQPSGAQVTLSHAYHSPGSYPIRVRARDQNGNEGSWSDTAVYAVINHPPSPVLNELFPPPPGFAGQEIHLTALVDDPEGEQVMLQADWGDKTALTYSGPQDSGTVFELIHTFESAAMYSIMLRAKDISENESEWSQPVEYEIIPNTPPAAVINEITPPSPVPPGLEIQLLATGYDPEGAPAMVQADWGDGAISDFGPLTPPGEMSPPFVHTYLEPGIVSIRVRAKDEIGLTGDWSAGFEYEITP